MSEQHKRFLNRLARSREAVMRVAQWLHFSGLDIEIPSVQFSPTAAESDSYIDVGDIFILTKQAIEVKRLGIQFSGSADWPFKEVFVSNKATVERNRGRVSAYISLSADMNYAAVVNVDTKPHWYEKQTRASNTGNMESFYACPIRYVKFCDLGIPP